MANVVHLCKNCFSTLVLNNNDDNNKKSIIMIPQIIHYSCERLIQEFKTVSVVSKCRQPLLYVFKPILKGLKKLQSSTGSLTESVS